MKRFNIKDISGVLRELGFPLADGRGSLDSFHTMSGRTWLVVCPPRGQSYQSEVSCLYFGADRRRWGRRVRFSARLRVAPGQDIAKKFREWLPSAEAAHLESEAQRVECQSMATQRYANFAAYRQRLEELGFKPSYDPIWANDQEVGVSVKLRIMGSPEEVVRKWGLVLQIK